VFRVHGETHGADRRLESRGLDRRHASLVHRCTAA
jgi:hypothetical protein